MNFSTNNFSYDLQDRMTGYHSPKFLLILLKLNGTVIVVLNSLVLTCLIVKKRLFSGRGLWYQLVCLSTNDVLAGVGVILMATVESKDVQRDLELCIIAYAGNIVAQIATLLNILAICMRRFFAVKYNHRFGKKLYEPWVSVAQMTTTWGISSLFCMIPFRLWKTRYVHIEGCSFETIFGSNYNKAVGFLFSGLIVPLILTNCIYVCTFIMMRRNLKKLNKIVPTSGGYTTFTTSSGNITIKIDTLPILKTRIILCNRKNKISTCNKLVNEKLPQHSSRSTISISSNIPFVPTILPWTESDSDKGRIRSEAGSDKGSRTDYDTSSAKKRAFVLIGIVLLTVNVLSWPAIIGGILSLIDSLGIGHGLKVGLLAFVTLNSLVNPFIYTFRVSEFKKILSDLKEKSKTCWC